MMMPERLKTNGSDEGGLREQFMRSRWAQIEPAHKAWKEGREMPLDGTPLAAWAGLTPEQAEVLRSHRIRTIEELRDMPDAVRDRIKLPNLRDLQKVAGVFLEGLDSSLAAERELQKDTKLAALQERLEEALERIADLNAERPEDTGLVRTASRGRNRPKTARK